MTTLVTRAGKGSALTHNEMDVNIQIPVPDTIAKVAGDSPYTVLTTDDGDMLLCNCTAGAITVNLLAAATAGDGFYIIIKKTDGTANAVTIDGNGSETIDGATTHTLSTQYETAEIVCDGSNWHIRGDIFTSIDADEVVYDNTTSGLTATDTQAAIDEVDGDLDTHIAATAAHGATGAVVGTTNSQTLTNKTLTSPVLNTGVSGTAVLDQDDMSSDSATQLATQQSIKAYVDSGTVTMTNKTITGLILDGSITEEGYSLTGVDIDPANGTIQYKTLTATSFTFTESLANNQSVLLLILNGSTATSVTWPTITWRDSDTPPTLGTADLISLVQINGTVYGSYVSLT